MAVLEKLDALLTFVQNESSKNLLYTFGKTNVAISGDTVLIVWLPF
jgi:hypothetical protein